MRNRTTLGLVAFLALVLASWRGANTLQRVAAATGGLPGTAALSGTVEAPKPFTAARVHLMNVDKHVLFMVYTQDAAVGVLYPDVGAMRTVAAFY